MRTIIRPLLLTAAFLCAHTLAALDGVPFDPPSADPVPQTPYIDTMAMGAVAVVGHNRIPADDVFELWKPIWYETLTKVRNGKMSPHEGDARLASEWEKAILSLIKEELFFQEAEREHQSVINNYVEMYIRQGDPRPRPQIANDIRRKMQQSFDANIREYNSIMIKQSGGLLKLHKVLEGRGLTTIQWQNRLKKKAFTNMYLDNILKPRAPDPGPKQIREYYTSHPDEFSVPGLVRFRHIFFSSAKRGAEQARDDAIDVWERLTDGEIDFADAAAAYSDDDESKTRGGLESGEEAVDPEREAYLADIRTALREETPGEIGPILESPFGCHVAVLIGVGPSTTTPFHEVQREITRKLQDAIMTAESDRYFATVRKKTEIRVLMRTYPDYLSCTAQAGMDVRRPQIYSTIKPEIITPRSRRSQ